MIVLWGINVIRLIYKPWLKSSWPQSWRNLQCRKQHKAIRQQCIRLFSWSSTLCTENAWLFSRVTLFSCTSTFTFVTESSLRTQTISLKNLPPEMMKFYQKWWIMYLKCRISYRMTPLNCGLGCSCASNPADPHRNRSSFSRFTHAWKILFIFKYKIQHFKYKIHHH